MAKVADPPFPCPHCDTLVVGSHCDECDLDVANPSTRDDKAQALPEEEAKLLHQQQQDLLVSRRMAKHWICPKGHRVASGRETCDTCEQWAAAAARASGVQADAMSNSELDIP